jgi:tripeptidyl-peptidase-1
MYFTALTVVGALAAQVAAAPFQATHVLHERREHVPKAWIKRDRLDAAAALPVRIGMIQSNLERGHDLLMEV